MRDEAFRVKERVRHKRWRERRKARIIASGRKYWSRNKITMTPDLIAQRKERTKTRLRNRRFKESYGLTADEVAAIFESQDFQCAICKRNLRGLPWRNGMHMDHCHKTGMVREGLCPQCNLGLGAFKDSVDSLRKAADYIKKWEDIACCKMLDRNNPADTIGTS